MNDPVPDNEKALLNLVRKAVKRSGGKINGENDVYRFDKSTLDYMRHAWWHCPWLMNLSILFYKICLNYQVYRIKQYGAFAWFDMQAEADRLDGFKFAVQNGRFADKRGREWAYEKRETHRINDSDASFLIWTGTLDIKRREIYFGHWDWISGFFNLVPVYIIIGAIIAAALCCNSSALDKSIQVVGGLLVATTLFNFSKSHSFDTFKVGSRYFKPYGLGIKPHPANYK